jgi:hypothetical protein
MALILYLTAPQQWAVAAAEAMLPQMDLVVVLAVAELTQTILGARAHQDRAMLGAPTLLPYLVQAVAERVLLAVLG